MPRRILIALAVGSAAVIPAVVLAATGDVSRQSLTYAGAQAPADAEGAAMSPDGDHLLFTSTSPLTGVATSLRRQLFMRDLGTGRIMLVSSSASGQPADDDVDEASYAASAGATLASPYGVSLDGRYVVFASTATNLVASDSNGPGRDVFRKDTVTGRITIVSRDSRGAQPPAGVTGQPSISASGARVAFTSGSAALVPADANGRDDIYLADIGAGTVTLVSRSSSGAQLAGDAANPAISADGKAIAFDGSDGGSTLVPGDADGRRDVYVARPEAPTIDLASVPPGGSSDADAGLPTIAGAGQRIAYRSPLATAGTAYLRDVSAGTTRALPGSAAGGRPAVSADGTRVAFTAAQDVVVFDVATAAVGSISHAADGSALSTRSWAPAIGGPGSPGVFSYRDSGTDATAAVPGDLNGKADVFTTELGTSPGGTPALTARATYSGRLVRISGRASADAGIATLTVGGRTARLSDDGSYSVAFARGTSDRSLVVEARSGTGVRASTSVAISGAGTRTATPRHAPRPRNLRATAVRPWVRASFVLPVRATWRVELRRRVAGPLRAAAFRMISAAKGPATSGRRTVRVRIPAATPAGRYQVRVLMSSARGLGTTARTITIPRRIAGRRRAHAVRMTHGLLLVPAPDRAVVADTHDDPEWSVHRRGHR